MCLQLRKHKEGRNRMADIFYNFSVNFAKKYGLEEAILLQNIIFWIAKNKVNGKHHYDGRTWTYNSIKAFTELFPFWSERQIRRILKSLIQQGALITGNYNKLPFDRTLWYALKDEEYFLSFINIDFTKSEIDILPNGKISNDQMVISTNANGKISNDQTVKPIPDNKPDNKHTDNKPDIYSVYVDDSHPPKKKFLDHVLLTEEEHQKLKERLGEEKVSEYIEALNNYIAQIGVKKAQAKYKSHYHVIMNWHRMDEKRIERAVAVRELIKKKSDW